MTGLWRNSENTREGKYLVKRRDGTIPEWPSFVIGAKDICAPAALREYAAQASKRGFDQQFVLDVLRMADEFEKYRLNNGTGDPDAPPHRKDDPKTIAEMASGHSA